MSSTDEPAAELLRVGDVTLDLSRQVVMRGGDELRLRPKTFDVLTVLVRHAGVLVSKQRLIESVWGDVAVTDDSLVQCLMEIRRALGDGLGAVRTVRGRGYLLVEQLTRPTGAGSAAGLSRPAAMPESPPPSWPAARGWTFISMAAVVLVAVVSAVTAIGPRSSAAEGVALQDTMNGEARRAFDEGLGLVRRSRAQTDMQRGRRLFERAVALDDRYASAHAALANTLVLLSVLGVQPALEVLPRAGVAARRAIGLDPTLAAGWQALAHFQTQGDWDWPGAERSYRRAIALDRSAPSNMVFGHLLVGIGHTDEALEESADLLALQPGSAWRQSSNCVVNYFARRSEEALAACDRALAIDPEESLAHYWRALALTALGRHDEAMQAALASRRGMGFAPTWLVGYVHARAGRLDDAREVLRAVEARAATTYVPPLDLAFLHAAVGDRAAALDWLERAHRAHGPGLELLAVHPAADPVRAEPRFRAILKALRLPELS
ncbi:MAG: winged helix-turn-helix domain-containing protein [Acidobacteriota bacterium]